MNKELHIVLLYSYGPHFLRTARTLRNEHTGAHITAILPRDFPVELLAGQGIRSIPVLPNPSENRSLRDVATVINAIRSLHPDIFVVLFDSPRLRTLASLSTAKTRYCYHVDGRVTPVRWTFTGNLFHSLIQGIYGRLRYARIWCHVHFTRVKRQAQTGTPASNDGGVSRSKNTKI